MRLSEIRQRAYYHGSKRRFPVGFILRPQSDGYVQAGTGHADLDDDILRTEQILEQYRPAEMISRRAAVFLVARPDADLIDMVGGDSAFIYRVAPIGQVCKASMFWYAKISTFVPDLSRYADPDDFPDLRRWASNYWHAKPGGGRWNNHEYLCRAARIIQLIQPAG
jgi:hypothetical protein